MKKFLSRYIGNDTDRTAALSAVSCFINAFFGAGKLILGIYLFSAWFMINALYYLVLCAARGRVLKKYSSIKQIEDSEKRYEMEFAVYRQSGIFLCFLELTYLLVCLRMYYAGDSTVYKGYTVYLVAAVAFTKLGFAVYGTAVTRRLENPIVSTLKIVSFTDAFVSIVVMESTLLSMERVEHASGYSAFTGMIVSAVFVLEGILMLAKKKRSLNQPCMKRQKRYHPNSDDQADPE